MATVTGYTAARTKEIEDTSIVGGLVNALGKLILRNRRGDEFDAGSVVGPRGPSGLGPPGSVIMFPGVNIPTGYLLCDGTPVSRVEYADLFNAIGTLHGAGDGVSTFNLPNFKGRVPVGQDPSDTSFDTIGEIGGAKTHTLTSSEMPSHTHVQNAHNHTQNSHNHNQNAHFHQVGVTSVADSGTIQAGLTQENAGNTYAGWTIGLESTTGGSRRVMAATTTATNVATTATNVAATAVNQSTGGGGAHNNLQPYIVVPYIIKT